MSEKKFLDLSDDPNADLRKIIQSGLQPRVHKCDVCGTEGHWSEAWSWWGSIGSESNGYVIKFCSDTCADCDPQAVWKRKYGDPANHRRFIQ